MELRNAYRILGVTQQDSQEIIKKKYHRLISKIHPDSASDIEYPFSVQEVIEAYSILMSNYSKNKRQNVSQASQKKEIQEWDAPQNPNAYIERDIYQHVYNQAGKAIGSYIIASGRYYWNPEAEDFQLFLKSIFSAAEKLLKEVEKINHREISEKKRFEVHKELNFLLAREYIDLESGMEYYGKGISGEEAASKIYVFYAFLELQRKGRKTTIQKGDILFPFGIKAHRLYLSDSKGEQLGYVSFQEDPLYYILVLLFENREVQVRIQAEEDYFQVQKKQQSIRVQLWIKRINRKNAIEQSINQKIENLLNLWGRG